MGATMLQPVPLVLIPLLPLYFLGVDDVGAVCSPTSGTTFVCSGDFSNGLNVGAAVPAGTTEVIVTGLTADIVNPTGIVWDLGPTTGPNPPTRTLNINTGMSIIRSDIPILMDSQGITDGPEGSPLGAFGLSLNFFGEIESTAPGSAILVTNAGNRTELGAPFGLNGGRCRGHLLQCRGADFGTGRSSSRINRRPWYLAQWQWSSRRKHFLRYGQQWAYRNHDCGRQSSCECRLHRRRGRFGIGSESRRRRRAWREWRKLYFCPADRSEFGNHWTSSTRCSIF